MAWFISPIVVALVCAEAAASVAQDKLAAPGWSVETLHGCRVWNPEPQPNETVTWSGSCPNGVANGFGVEQWFQDGRPSNRIEGVYRDGKLGGMVTIQYPNGSSYSGEFRDNRFNGEGTYTWKSGDRYVGHFEAGKRQGNGTYFYASGNKYVGEFRDGKREGRGTFFFANGSKYIGEYRNSKRNGQGTMYRADGTISASGKWIDDKIAGAGAAVPPQSAQPQNPAAQQPRLRRGSNFGSCEADHWIDSVIDDGSIVKLEDGSLWEVALADQVDASLWLPTTEITVCEGKLINTEDNEAVEAIRLR